MEKKIQDYLHLYYGCEKYYPETNETGVVDWTSLLNVWSTEERGDEFISHYQLVLRPLQYMTEEEIEHTLWLIHDSEIHLDKESRISKEEMNNCIDSTEHDDRAIVVNHTIRCFEGRLYISEHSGQIRLFDENDKECPIEWKPELYRYLLSKHFDLFGLIEAGLAIDKSKMNTESK